MNLRPCQFAAVDHVVSFFRSAARGSRCSLAAPTGSGKSLVEIAVRDALGEGCWIITPRLEIAWGILEKDGVEPSVEACWERRVVTPVRFRNALLRGEVPRVSALLFDEGHHAVARTWEEVQLLCGMPPAALFTATPYRGTARGTAKFLEEWGEPTWMVTLREAAKLGYVSVPRCEVMPLVDDDVVEIGSGGEFDVSSVESAYASRLEDLAERSAAWASPLWDRPTVFALPTVQCAASLAEALQRRGAPACVVDAATPRTERRAAFAALASGAAAVCQVAVLGEGVDLPVRRLVDAAPKLSPVAWMQQLGRCTRPSPEPPEYVCTNRNLARHAYLLEGMVPPAKVAEAELAFGGPGKRGGLRGLGLEAIGRFKSAEVRCLSGCTALLYCLFEPGRMRELACFVHPAVPDPVWAERVHAADAAGRKVYGRWRRAAAPEDLRGFSSFGPRDLTEKMRAFWERSAAGRGLDPEQKVTRKNFSALPLLLDLGMRVL